MMRLYIASPYAPKGCSLHDASRVVEQNVQRAIKAFHALKKNGGHTPFVPVLSHYLHIGGSEDYGDWWYDYDLTFLERWAEGLVLLEGWKDSKGCKIELAVARRLGLRIYELVDGELVVYCHEVGGV